MSEERATYRAVASADLATMTLKPAAPPSMAMTLNELSGVILDVERVFPDAGYEIAKAVYRVRGRREVEFWAEIAVDRERGIEFDAYGDSPADALRNALALARKAANR